MTWQRRLWKQLQVRCLTSSSSHPPKTYFLTFDDKEKRIFKYNTMYLAFFPLIHSLGILQTSSWPSLTSLIFLCQARHAQTNSRSKCLEIYFIRGLSVLELFQFIKSVGENLTQILPCSVTATSSQKEHLCVIWRVAGQQVWDVNVSHYTHNNWPKNPSRWLTPYAVAPFLPLFISFPLLPWQQRGRLGPATKATITQANYNLESHGCMMESPSNQPREVEIVLKERRERKSHPVGMQPMDTPQYQPIIACFRYAWCSCLATATVPREGRGRWDWFGILALQLVSIAENNQPITIFWYLS